MHLLEIAARVAIVYLGCIVLIRISGRRELSELGPIDLLGMLLLSETVSPAMTGGDDSLEAGLFAAASLMGLAVAISHLTFRHRKLGHLLEGHAVVLIERGRVRPKVMRRYRISDEDLSTALHEQGMIHVNEVARAYLEPDGEITMIKEKDLAEAQRYIHRR